jgi:hypothetical protein
MTNGRSNIVALFAAVTWLVPSTVEAQRVAVSYSQFPFPHLTEVINLGTAVAESREPRVAIGSPVFTSDGRFLLLRFRRSPGLPPLLEIRDLVTGFRTPLDLQFEPRHAHPRRLAVYGLTPMGVARLDEGGLRPYAACDGLTTDVELTVDGSRLLVLCGGLNGSIVTIDEATGVRLSVRVLDTGTTLASGLALNADGSQALVIRHLFGPAPTELVLFDVATGAEIIATPMPGPPPPAPFAGPGIGRIVSVTPSRDAVVVTRRWFLDYPGLPPMNHNQTHLLELATLAPRGQLAVPYELRSIAISPDGGRAFVASDNLLPQSGLIQDLDLRTGQQTAGVSVAFTSALGAAFAPLAPTLQPAVVNGQQVTIAWSLAAHSPAAQRFVIHVGSRSGATDLGTRDVGDATSLTVPGVPPGRYFVRMTAVNFTGTSSPSTELIVDVPGQ